jgi:hypothetical protein
MPDFDLALEELILGFLDQLFAIILALITFEFGNIHL